MATMNDHRVRLRRCYSRVLEKEPGLSVKLDVDLSLAADRAMRGAETDALFGIEGAIGSGQADTFRGDGGANLFRGNAGADLLTGGAGADLFDYDAPNDSSPGANRDRISGFSRTEGDKLHVDGIDANLNLAGDQDFVFKGTAAFTGIGQIRVVSSGTDRIIQLNNDSDKQADVEIVLRGFDAPVLASDFNHL